jgi:hypothetical protein
VTLAETLAGEDLLVELDCQRADRVATLLRSLPLPLLPPPPRWPTASATLRWPGVAGR